MVVPDLPCELWFRRLEAARTDWQMLQDNLAGVKETDMILDQQGHGVGLFVFELWLVRMLGKDLAGKL